MSWDAYLYVKSDGNEFDIFEQNYTHNCNKMISIVLEDAGYNDLEEHWLIGRMGKSWFEVLNGMSGEDGARLLKMIIFGLEKDPAKFRAMNPENGWGSYDKLLEILRKMLSYSVDNPSAYWRVSG